MIIAHRFIGGMTFTGGGCRTPLKIVVIHHVYNTVRETTIREFVQLHNQCCVTPEMSENGRSGMTGTRTQCLSPSDENRTYSKNL